MVKYFDTRAEPDPTDIAMIEVLQDNVRISVSELGRKIGLSQPATPERLKQLEERGIITGYRAVVDPAAVRHGRHGAYRFH